MNRGRLAAFLGSAVLLVATIGTGMLEHDHSDSLLWVDIAVIAGLLFINIGLPMAMRRSETFEFVNVFVLFYMAGYIVRPLILVFAPDQISFEHFWDWRDVNNGVYYVVLGFAAFFVGYQSMAGPWLARLVTRPREIFAPLRAAVAFFGMVTTGLGAYLVHAYLLGGIGAFLESLLYDRSHMYLGYGWLVPAQNLAILVIPFGYAYLYSERRLRLPFILCGLVVMAVLLVPMSRGVFLTWIVIFAVYRHYAVRRIRAMQIGGLSLVAVVILVGLQFAREWVFGTVQDYSIGEALLYVYSGTFNSFETAMMVISYYERASDLWYGVTFVQAALYPWLPRALWSDKPMVYGGTAITEPIGAFFASRTNVTAETLGELYANFAAPGIVVGMAFVGVLGRTAYVGCIESGRSKASVLFYAYLVALIPGWLRVGLGGLVYYFLTFLAPAAIALFWVHARTQVREGQTAPTRAHA